MTCPCPQPSLHDRVLRAINIRNGTKCTDLVSAAARLLVKLREQEADEADHNEQLDAPPEDYALLIADIDNETCCSEEATEIGLPGWSREQDRHCPRSATARGCAVSSVYFIQAGASGPIKIGVSVDPISRMAQMQTGMPETLRLLAFIAGTRDDERKLHIKLAAHRIRGEWFHPHQDVLGALRIS